MTGLTCDSLTSSARFLAGTDGCTQITLEKITAMLIGARSFIGSYGRLATVCGATVSEPTLASTTA